MSRITRRLVVSLPILLLLVTSLMAQPTITQQPQDQTVLEGETATFLITATSDAPMVYQWFKNGVSISGANSNSYITPPTVLADNGANFSCIVADSNGFTPSNVATLTVNPGEPPLITVQPEDQGVVEGQTATFFVTATGTEPLNYQWRKNGVNIAGATNASYTTPATLISLDNQSYYSCVVTNNYGVTASNDAYLYVVPTSGRVTANLQVLYEFEDRSGDLIRDVSGNGDPEDIRIITPENVAWTPNGLETFANATTRRDVKNSKIKDNCMTSNEITFEVWVKPEFIPQNSRRIFTFSLSGNFRNFSIISEGNHYDFRLRTTLTDDDALPGISSSPGTQNNELTHLVYTRKSDGTAKIFVNGVLDFTGNVPGDIRFSDNAWLAIGSEPLGGLTWRGMHYLAAVYDRALTDFEVQHNYSQGTPVDNKPYFTIHPKNQYIVEGESIFLDSYSVSVLPISYQWRKNGNVIPDATDRQLNLSGLSAADNGAVFESRATTSAGTTTSNSAVVYVTGINERVNDGIRALYTFREGSGSTINDVSGVGGPLNFTIFGSDAVQWENYGLRIVSAPSIITTSSASKITNALKASNSMTIEAWLSPANNAQSSPSRIFTISADESNRNFSLGQNNDSYEINLRTTSTDNNGLPSISSSGGTVSTTGFDHVVFTRSSNGTANFYVNGTLRVTQTIAGDFSNWNMAYLSALGNEFGVDHHWEGLVNLIAVFDRDLTGSEVLRNYNFGPYGVVAKPSDVTLVSNQIGKIKIAWTDNSNNEDGFIIERGEGDPVVYSVIANVPTDSTEFTDENVVDNKVYYYRVKSYYSLGESDYSEPLTVKSLITPMNAPTDLKTTAEFDGYPKLTWNDNTDRESGYVIQRRRFAQSFVDHDTVDADVTSYTDRKSVQDSTTYIYRVFAFNADTTSGYSNEASFDVVIVGVESDNQIPTEFSLSQNYPNPFNPTTIIKFGLPEKSNINISIFNMIGQKVFEAVNNVYSAGIHEYNFNGRNLTSGIYIYSITASSSNGNVFKESKKMMLIK